MGELKELCEDPRRRIDNLHNLGKSIGAIFKQYQIPSFQFSGRRSELLPSDERKLVRMFANNRRTTASQVYREIETTQRQAAEASFNSFADHKRIPCSKINNFNFN